MKNYWRLKKQVDKDASMCETLTRDNFRLDNFVVKYICTQIGIAHGCAKHK
jgi:hypothetical protein